MKEEMKQRNRFTDERINRNGRQAAYSAILAACLLLATAVSTRAQTTITVNSTAQEATTDNPNGIVNGNCTLGEAILSANTGTSVDSCTFTGNGAPYTIELTNDSFTLTSVHNYWYGPNALPPVAGNMVIDGNGATLQITDPTIVRMRFFYVGANPQASGTLGFNTPGSGQLTLRNVTLVGGRQKGGEAFSDLSGGGGAGMGGAIFNQGVLQLVGVTISGSIATGGSTTLSGLGGGGGGMGQDASAAFTGSAGGFGGPVTPAGSNGSPDNTAVGGGGGGFNPADNGQSGASGGFGGGLIDGLGGAGQGSDPNNLNFQTGHGSGSGSSNGYSYDCSGSGGSFGSGGSSCGGGGVGGGGGSDFGGGGGGGGFGGGGGSEGAGGFGGGTTDTSHTSFGGSSRGSGAGFGGAIFNHGGTLNITNSTLTANAANGGGGAFGYGGASGFGGAIFNLNGTVTLAFSTLDGNSIATGDSPGLENSADGGAIYSLGYNLASGQAATLTISNSILANSTGGSDLVSNQPSNVANAAGGGTNVATASLTFTGANIVMTSSTNTSSGPFPLSADPQLAPLALNSPGLTQTMAISAGSPAVDAAVCDPNIITDQRGVSRPQGASCDIGAYELMLTPQTITFTGLPPTATYGAAGPYTLTATATSGLPVTYSVTGPATLAGSTLTIVGAGLVTVTASQAGNSQYAAATPVEETIMVTPAAQTITFNPIPAQVAGASVTLNASASSGLPVTFASLTGSVCTVSGSTATMIAVGTCSIQASQLGNSQYQPAAPVTQSFTVTSAATFIITPEPGSETIKLGTLAVFVLELKSVNGFNGSVKLACSGGPIGAKCANLPETVHVRGTALAVSGIFFPIKTAAGTYTMTFTGMSGSITVSTTAKFTVK